VNARRGQLEEAREKQSEILQRDPIIRRSRESLSVYQAASKRVFECVVGSRAFLSLSNSSPTLLPTNTKATLVEPIWLTEGH